MERSLARHLLEGHIMFSLPRKRQLLTTPAPAENAQLNVLSNVESEGVQTTEDGKGSVSSETTQDQCGIPMSGSKRGRSRGESG